jgi:ABC-type multidrug transport system fused ATPase/permease subunit
VQTGQLISRCIEDVRAVQSFIGSSIVDLTQLIFILFGALFIMFNANWQLTLIAIIPIFPLMWMTFKFGDEILPRAYGFPMKIRVPTKLGFKNPKYVISMEVTNDYKGGFWEDQA